MPDRVSDWTLVREALEAAPCIVTWCAPDHPCSRCAALAALERLEPRSDALACGCGWIFVDATDVARGCPACALGVRVDA